MTLLFARLTLQWLPAVLCSSQNPETPRPVGSGASQRPPRGARPSHTVLFSSLTEGGPLTRAPPAAGMLFLPASLSGASFRSQRSEKAPDGPDHLALRLLLTLLLLQL